MDSIDVDFAQSLVQLQGMGDMKVAFLPGSLVYVARDKLAEQALALETDYILWLDSDMVFGPELLHDLMRADRDFVTGLYFRRRPPFTPVLYSKIRYGMTPEEFVHEEYEDYPKDSVFEIDACGFGAVLMKTSIIRDVQREFGYLFAPMKGFGEDISFCIRAKQCGYKLFCDSSVKLGHVTRSVANEETYLQLKERQS
jgi:GT2 family glycosyltransferase